MQIYSLFTRPFLHNYCHENLSPCFLKFPKNLFRNELLPVQLGAVGVLSDVAKIRDVIKTVAVTTNVIYVEAQSGKFLARICQKLLSF